VTAVPKQPTVDALAAVWSSLRGVLAQLDHAAWRTPTALAGWDVQANVAHIVGTEAMLAGDPSPDVTVDRDANPHVRNDIGQFNEVWVQALRDESPADVLARFDDLTARRLAALRSMDDDAWDAESFTPAGKDTYGRFMRIRVFDCWFHEQDVREALDRPGHADGPAVQVVLDEVASAMGFVVGKKAGAPTGSSVTFELTGDDGAVVRAIHVVVGERAQVVDRLDGDATTTIRIPVVAFTRLCGGRAGADRYLGGAQVTGDTELGERVLANLAYTI
jgi:uncharacterized protein (TIGR03083 family)